MEILPFKSNPLKLLRLFLAITIFEGIIVLFSLFQIKSNIENAFLAGYSLLRVLMGTLILFLVIVFTIILVNLGKSRKILTSTGKTIVLLLQNEPAYVFIETSLILILTGILIALLLFLFPETQRFFPFLKETSLFRPLGERGGVLMIWACLIIYKILIMNNIYSKRVNNNHLSFPVKAMTISWAATLYFTLCFIVFLFLKQPIDAHNFLNITSSLLVLSLFFSFWGFHTSKPQWVGRYSLLFECVSIWLVIFLISVQFAQWFDVLRTSNQNSFNLLADAFLHGRLFLSDPIETYDLTMFNGKWYVPFPPFPAILMIPFVAILGVAGFNTTIFTLALAASTSVVVYLILDQLFKLGWISLSRSKMVWLIALLSFGTVQFWLSLVSNSSFTSQIVTTLFIALAFLCVVKKCPPWLTGICLVGAILSRPNTFVIWLALAAIEMQLLRVNKNNLDIVLSWILGSAIPVIIGVAGLLLYNYVRFENFTDFGYTTVNGAEWLVRQAQTYGVFSPHFIPSNFYWMFLGFQSKLISQCAYYIPRGNGMSVLLTTPAFVYIFRRFKISWWIIGCWISILLSTIMLLMYHNNGAIQVGYRYILDMVIPLIMLLSYSIGKKISVPFKILVLLSICVNYYLAISWFMSPC